MGKLRSFLTGHPPIKSCDSLEPHEPHIWEELLVDETFNEELRAKRYCNGS